MMMLPFSRWTVCLALCDGIVCVYLVDNALRDMPKNPVVVGHYQSNIEAFYQFNIVADSLKVPKVRWA